MPSDRESPVCQIPIVADPGLQEFGVDEDEWGKLVDDGNSDDEFGEYYGTESSYIRDLRVGAVRDLRKLPTEELGKLRINLKRHLYPAVL